jgi:hypothetical protein
MLTTDLPLELANNWTDGLVLKIQSCLSDSFLNIDFSNVLYDPKFNVIFKNLTDSQCQVFTTENPVSTEIILDGLRRIGYHILCFVRNNGNNVDGLRGNFLQVINNTLTTISETMPDNDSMITLQYYYTEFISDEVIPIAEQVVRLVLEMF